MLAASRVIRLELPASQSAPIIADALRIGQVVTNYLTNALKYSKEHQPVEVRLEVEGDSARIYVHDDGVGIPYADQQRVWERFHKAADITVQSGSSVSLGLGLHINKNIVERHLGQVGVISAPGQGTTFWFALPLTKPGDTWSFHAR
jgi:signal transduction histidine kinase